MRFPPRAFGLNLNFKQEKAYNATPLPPENVFEANRLLPENAFSAMRLLPEIKYYAGKRVLSNGPSAEK